MAGTRAGGLAARDTNLKKNPNFYKDIGKIGGLKGTGHDFGHGKLDPSEMGKKGGSTGWTAERRQKQSRWITKVNKTRRNHE